MQTIRLAEQSLDPIAPHGIAELLACGKTDFSLESMRTKDIKHEKSICIRFSAGINSLKILLLFQDAASRQTQHARTPSLKIKMLCHFMKKGHRSDLASFMQTTFFCPLRAFSSGRDGRLSSSYARGNHASSCANGCSADTSSSFRSTSQKNSMNRRYIERFIQSKCKRTQNAPTIAFNYAKL